MSEFAIRVQRLSKQYTIEAVRSRHDSLRDLVADAFRSLVRRNGRPHGGKTTFWALKEISLELKQGEIVGIIGRNGAGKSTLLKILSRITEPTSGRAEIYGRVGSLLEVGTGFDRELTGGENIYLSGAILGMQKAEIKRKFDEIVAFAEVERFIDTPVKRYSSGMYVRLAFAVAAHLEPDILIVDEVLAVGDGRFQKKCLNKMQDVGHQGRTVFFVSHNMQAITRLCNRAILLHEGKVVLDGDPKQVVSTYLNEELDTKASREWSDPTKAPSGEVARLCSVRVRTLDGRVTDVFEIQESCGVDMEYEVKEAGHVLMPAFRFFNDQNVYLFSGQDLDPTWRRRPRQQGRYISTVWIPGNLLSEGRIYVDVSLCVLEPVIQQFSESRVVAFQVVEGLGGGPARGDWAGEMGGVVRPLLKWTTQSIPNRKRASNVMTEAQSPENGGSQTNVELLE